MTLPRGFLGVQAPGVPLLESRMGEVDAQLILGPGLHAKTDALAPALDHAARFVSTTLTTAYSFQRPALEAALNALPAQVLRAKGLVFLEGEAAPRVLQLGGRRWSLEPPGPAQSSQRSRIVFIAARDPQAPPFHPWSHFGDALSRDALSQTPGDPAAQS